MKAPKRISEQCELSVDTPETTSKMDTVVHGQPAVDPTQSSAPGEGEGEECTHQREKKTTKRQRSSTSGVKGPKRGNWAAFVPTQDLARRDLAGFYRMYLDKNLDVVYNDSMSGPGNAPIWRSEVQVPIQPPVVGVGTAPKLKDARTSAAYTALLHLCRREEKSFVLALGFSVEQNRASKKAKTEDSLGASLAGSPTGASPEVQGVVDLKATETKIAPTQSGKSPAVNQAQAPKGDRLETNILTGKQYTRARCSEAISQLNIVFQDRLRRPPSFEACATDPATHAFIARVELKLPTATYVGEGKSRNKKLANRLAACDLMDKLLAAGLDQPPGRKKSTAAAETQSASSLEPRMIFHNLCKTLKYEPHYETTLGAQVVSRVRLPSHTSLPSLPQYVEGRGRTVKEAEKDAAKNALDTIRALDTEGVLHTHGTMSMSDRHLPEEVSIDSSILQQLQAKIGATANQLIQQQLDPIPVLPITDLLNRPVPPRPPLLPAVEGEVRAAFLQHTARPQYLAMLQQRSKLPIFEHREKIMELVQNHQVTLVSGETGCGKTTQLPQFILAHETLAGRGSRCHVVCTQPRRLAAMSIAQRVAQEHGEPLGGHIGYQVRFQKQTPTKIGQIEFCTSGIFLKRLLSDPNMSDVTHLVIDEVHERDINVDLLLVVMKEILPKLPHVKLILMSATIDTTKFLRFFSCPQMAIPGRLFPVEEFYLEDIVPSTSMKNVPLFELERSISYPLLADLIASIHANEQEGAILVFLPGWQEITSALAIVRSRCGERSLSLVPLHSALQAQAQAEAFQRPPAGKRKVVFSTNIAETSITIDDIVYVIDCGWRKCKSYDLNTGISFLLQDRISRSSAVQRAGRAGRIRSGKCYRLYTRKSFRQFPDADVPEIFTLPLEEVALQLKALGYTSIDAFFARAIDRPSATAVMAAEETLRNLGATTHRGWLTPLGRALASLPISPHVGKLLLIGIVFQCVDPIATICARLESKDPVLFRTTEDRTAMREIHKSFHPDSLSDLISFLDLWQQYISAANKEDYCTDHYLRLSTMKLMERSRHQILELVQDFVAQDQQANAQAGNIPLLKAVLCAGFSENILAIRKFKGKNRPDFRMKDGKQVFPHPSSLLHKNREALRYRWVVFGQMLKTSELFARFLCVAETKDLLLFSRDFQFSLEPNSDKGIASGHGWVSAIMTPMMANTINGLRGAFDYVVSGVLTHHLDSQLEDYRSALIQYMSTATVRLPLSAPSSGHVPQVMAPTSDSRFAVSNRRSRGNAHFLLAPPHAMGVGLQAVNAAPVQYGFHNPQQMQQMQQMQQLQQSQYWYSYQQHQQPQQYNEPHHQQQHLHHRQQLIQAQPQPLGPSNIHYGPVHGAIQCHYGADDQQHVIFPAYPTDMRMGYGAGWTGGTQGSGKQR